METYHKISTPFKRHMSGPKKGKLIVGDWAKPEFEYLKDCQWNFTEKIDGQNGRILYRPAVALENGFGPVIEFAGRSDSANLHKSVVSYVDKTFCTERFREVFPDVSASGVLLFGEFYGPKIQDGGKYRDDVSFILFDVKINDLFLSRDNVADVANKLGIDSVPFLGTGTIQDAIDIVSTGLTWDRKGKMTNWGGNGVRGLRSQWGNFEAEGIIAEPVVPMFDRMGNRIITKIKARDFK